MHTAINAITEHTHHLQELDSIAGTLQRIEHNLVGPATGRKQVPLVTHLVIVLVLCATFLVILLQGSNKSVTIGPTGFSIQSK